MTVRVADDVQHANLRAACFSYLAYETSFLTETLDQLKQIRAAMLNGDSKRLQSISETAAIDSDSAPFREVADARAEICERVARDLGMPKEDVTFKTIAKLAHGDSEESMEKTIKEVQNLSQTIDTYNRRNSMLANQLSSINDQVLDAILGPANEVYDLHGQILTDQKSHFVEKEV